MLKNFNNILGLLPVFLNNDFYCDIYGNLYNKRKELIKLDRDQEGNLGKFISLWGYSKFYKIGIIVAAAFKSVKIHESLLHILDVMHLDDNKENNHASNVIWKFPSGGLRHPRYKDFSYIPGYTAYIIDKNGTLMEHREGKIIYPFYEEGYAKVRIKPDAGFRKQTGIHRLVALAWLEYPVFVDTLVVNHKDGIPGNDFDYNLEFISRCENNVHASNNGLLTKGREIHVKNYETNDVFVFSGTSSCAKYYSLNRSTIKYRLHSGQQIYPGNLVFKYAYDKKPWRNDLQLTTKELNKGSSESVIVKHIFTGEILSFDSIKQASSNLDIPIMTIHSQLKISKSKRPTHNYLFKYASDKTEWNKYTDDELAVFKKYPKGKNLGVKVKNRESSEIITFIDIEHLMTYFKISMNELKKFKVGKGILASTFIYVTPSESLNPFN